MTKIIDAQGPENPYLQDMSGQRKSVVEHLRRAMQRGVVVTDGGWEIRGGPHGFVPWCWWGIITDVRENGSITGATLNGFVDNPLHHVANCWLAELDDSAISSADADREMIKLAVARLRSERPFVNGQVVYGLAALDLMIKQMETYPWYCPVEAGRSLERAWLDTNDNAGWIMAGAKVVASSLERHAPSFPDAARPHLRAAASHYQRIVDLLEPVISTEEYRRIIGDMEKQKSHARDVLQGVRAEMADAAIELSQALEAS